MNDDEQYRRSAIKGNFWEVNMRDKAIEYRSHKFFNKCNKNIGVKIAGIDNSPATVIYVNGFLRTRSNDLGEL